MSKITNDGLTQSGTGCCIYMATVGVKAAVKGLTHTRNYALPQSYVCQVLTAAVLCTSKSLSVSCVSELLKRTHNTV